MNIKKVLFRIGCAFAFVGSLASCGSAVSISGTDAVIKRAITETPTTENFEDVKNNYSSPKFVKTKVEYNVVNSSNTSSSKNSSSISDLKDNRFENPEISEFLVGSTNDDENRVFAYDKNIDTSLLFSSYKVVESDDDKITNIIKSEKCKSLTLDSADLENSTLTNLVLDNDSTTLKDYSDFKSLTDSINDDFFKFSNKEQIIPDLKLYSDNLEKLSSTKVKYTLKSDKSKTLIVEATSLSGFSIGTGPTVYFEYNDHTVVAQIGIYTISEYAKVIGVRIVDGIKEWFNNLFNKNSSTNSNSDEKNSSTNSNSDENYYFIKNARYYDSEITLDDKYEIKGKDVDHSNDKEPSESYIFSYDLDFSNLKTENISLK
jgi:hypothetical protein